VPTITVPTNDVDQTAYIAQQLALVANGDTVTLANPTPGVASRVDGPVVVAGRHNLVIAGPGGGDFFRMATALTGQQAGYVDSAGKSQRVHLRAAGGSTGITFRGFKVRGPNTARQADTRFAVYSPSKEAEHAFSVAGLGTRDILFEDCEFDDVHGDGCSVGPTGVPGPQNVTFRRITGRYCGRHAHNITTGSATFEDNHITGHGRSGIDIEPNSVRGTFVDSVAMRRCELGGSLYFVSLTGVGDGPDLRGDFVFEDNVHLFQKDSNREAFHCNGGGRSLRITGNTGLQSNGATYALDIAAVWSGLVAIEDNLLSSKATGIAIHGGGGAQVGLEVRRNNFGRAAIFSDAAASITAQCGNTWGTGASTDSPCAVTETPPPPPVDPPPDIRPGHPPAPTSSSRVGWGRLATWGRRLGWPIIGSRGRR
jgi:hypothetical protein